jgi:hypothetical protein
VAPIKPATAYDITARPRGHQRQQPQPHRIAVRLEPAGQATAVLVVNGSATVGVQHTFDSRLDMCLS